MGVNMKFRFLHSDHPGSLNDIFPNISSNRGMLGNITKRSEMLEVECIIMLLTNKSQTQLVGRFFPICFHWLEV